MSLSVLCSRRGAARLQPPFTDRNAAGTHLLGSRPSSFATNYKMLKLLWTRKHAKPFAGRLLLLSRTLLFASRAKCFSFSTVESYRERAQPLSGHTSPLACPERRLGPTCLQARLLGLFLAFVLASVRNRHTPKHTLIN